MNSDSRTLSNHFEVFYQTKLSSWLSKLIHFRRNLNHHAEVPHDSIAYEQNDTTSITYNSSEKPQISSWELIGQVISTIIVWIILGFATGFLFGMI